MSVADARKGFRAEAARTNVPTSVYPFYYGLETQPDRPKKPRKKRK